MGVSRLDIAFDHELHVAQFAIALKGAFPAFSRMRNIR
jgi:hypothetical protein